MRYFRLCGLAEPGGGAKGGSGAAAESRRGGWGIVSNNNNHSRYLFVQWGKLCKPLLTDAKGQGTRSGPPREQSGTDIGETHDIA
ncbi:hypothetical protein NBRC116598_25780 [Pseudophaeobacter arcticus]|uniref:Uncharacterized protein n=1 Tax=Pseudophaeobacter arcticus TaxID=385492 RepID=A0ABQ0AMN0_9RHOB